MPTRYLRHLIAAAAVAHVAIATAQAQPTVRGRSGLWVGSPLDEYVRLLQLTGEVPLSSRLLRPLDGEMRSLALDDSAAPSKNPWRARYGSRQRVDTAAMSIELYDPILRSVYNSAIPFGTNDGVMWAGRGISAAMDLGAALRYGSLTVRVAPTVTYSQNADFELGALHPRFVNGVAQPGSIPSDMSPFADPYMSFIIDMPQRFGDRSLRRLDWGQSSVRVEKFGVQAAIGTENMWWGAGQENALIVTNNAGGFPRLTLGTSKPANIGIGRLEAVYTAGRLRGSDYWRQAPPDSIARRRWMNALAFVFEPRGAPGLYLGAARLFYAYEPAGGVPVSELFEIFQPFTKSSFQNDSNPSGNDQRDQMISVFVRWVMPASHFELYGEIGRNDHPVDRRDLVLEPDHSAAYIAGFQKLFPIASGFIRASGEVADLAGGLTTLVRAQPNWYAHYIIRQGYTQNGQVIGAGVGPGGESTSFRLDKFSDRGSVGGFVQWQRVNTDAYFSEHVGQFQRHYHDVFLGFGARGTITAGPAHISAEFLRQKEYNRYGVLKNDVVNYHLRLGVEVRVF